MDGAGGTSEVDPDSAVTTKHTIIDAMSRRYDNWQRFERMYVTDTFRIGPHSKRKKNTAIIEHPGPKTKKMHFFLTKIISNSTL